MFLDLDPIQGLHKVVIFIFFFFFLFFSENHVSIRLSAESAIIWLAKWLACDSSPYLILVELEFSWFLPLFPSFLSLFFKMYARDAPLLSKDGSKCTLWLLFL